MDQLIEFFINHWFLWSLFIILIVAVFVLESQSQVGGVAMISPQQLVQLLNREHGAVLDIRGEEAYGKGHIIDALCYSEDEIKAQVKKLNKYKSKPVIVVCKTGQHGPKIGSILIQAGFEKVYALKGGMQAWSADNLPLVTAK